MKNRFSQFSDKELVSLLRGGRKESEHAFGEIYDRYAMRVNAYCRTILNDRDLAEDIFQETFMRFFQKVRDDYQTGSIIGYLITIARNLCLNAKRDRKSTVPIDDFDFPQTETQSYEDKELMDLMIMSIDLLDFDTKEVLALRVFNDLPYNEIAEILNITAARARYLFFTAKDKLKNILSPYLKDNLKKIDR